ncbi:hypothetical protein D3C84_918560 [compost metagenome]
MPGPGRHQQYVAGADAHFIGIAQGQRAAAGLYDEQVPPGMNVAVQHRAGFQPLHGHRHARRELATFDSSFMGQRDNIDFAALETLAHACKFGRLPYPSTGRRLVQTLAKVLI